MNPEEERIAESSAISEEGFSLGVVPPWERWGPYLSERGWGSVREDYSADGDAWIHFPHEHARARAYRRAEDGIAGFSDRYQVLLFAPAFWNGKDSILKERLFGLNPYEGNHAEDVKEIYYHLDATPTHSYLKYLYKYPQAPFPYEKLVRENQGRGLQKGEYELVDTGIFDENRYFDIFIEYAKAGPEDICIRITAINRGPVEAPLHILPHLWFRNQWAWGEKRGAEPLISAEDGCLVADDRNLISPRNLLSEYHLGIYYLYGAPGFQERLFTNNESNAQLLWGQLNSSPYVKDAFHRYLIENEESAIHPEAKGTKAAFHYAFPAIGPGETRVVSLRLSNTKKESPFTDFDQVFLDRKKEADLFYASIHPPKASEEEKQIQRQAFAGMIWSKQHYHLDVGRWLDGDDPKHPPPEEHKHIRNVHWRHLISMRILSMPDKWEFPWFASWDLAFHTLTFALIDLDFAKQQLWLLLFDQFQHPNGQIPAYEWEFSDVNPPLQGWALLKIFEYEKERFGREDFAFLEKCFHKLLLNFSWWVNRIDTLGNNVFEGGFLGMDNISFTDRSEKMPPGFLLDQADGAGWVSLFCLNLMRIALLLAKKNPVYEGLGIKFFQHFVFVTAAMRQGQWRPYDLFCKEEGFFYSYLRHPDGKADQIRIRSLTGIIPFFACDVWDEEELKQYPNFYYSYQWMLDKKQQVTNKCVQQIAIPGKGTKHLFGVLDQTETQRFLRYLWDPKEFRSEYGLRSLSKYHEEHPATLYKQQLYYEPGESHEMIKGGNSNWRGPIWMPINYFLIDTLMRLGTVFEERLKIEAPGETPVTLREMAFSFAERALAIFKQNKEGKRPFYGDVEKLQKDPNFSNYYLFHEHFHGDTGRGLGASHQTGWTGLIANLIDQLRR
ncbi:MAG: glucosidase [Verrucomicrobiota bacterium]|nr:glucosidase [Verrucomicrobiota bacterium]